MFDAFSKSSLFISQLVADNIVQTPWKDIERERTIQLRELLVKLGPTFIKVGQAISIRPDIISQV